MARDKKKFWSCIFGRNGSCGHEFATDLSWAGSFDLGMAISALRGCKLRVKDDEELWSDLSKRDETRDTKKEMK